VKAGGKVMGASMASNATLDVGTTTNLVGTVTTTTTVKAGGAVTGATLASNGTIIATTQSKAADLWATDDAYIADAFFVGGLTTLNKTNVTSVAFGVSVPLTGTTTLTSATATKTMYPMDGSGGTATLALPDATTVPGKPFVISAPVDMAANDIVVSSVNGHLGSGGNVHSLTSTDATASLMVQSDGVNYVILSRVGTWT
jgi:hypothetical protein